MSVLSEKDEETGIRNRLRPESTNQARLEAFYDAGMPSYMLKIGLGVTSSQLDEVEAQDELLPSSEAFIRLDRMRCCLARLMDGGINAERGAMIIISADETLNPPVSPIEAIAADNYNLAYEIVGRSILLAQASHPA